MFIFLNSVWRKLDIILLLFELSTENMDSEFEGWEDFSMSRLKFVPQDGANGCKWLLFYVFVYFVR